MARQLHKKKGKEEYALYSTITDRYITEWKSKDEIEQIWLNDLIEHAKLDVKRYMSEVDEEVDEEVD